jgi:hypothetical protein
MLNVYLVERQGTGKGVGCVHYDREPTLAGSLSSSTLEMGCIIETSEIGPAEQASVTITSNMNRYKDRKRERKRE